MKRPWRLSPMPPATTAALPLSDFAPACSLSENNDLHDLARLDGVPEPLFLLLTVNPRRPDLLAEHDAILALLALGYPQADIVSASGLSAPAIARRLRLSNLLSGLRGSAAALGLSNSVLESCAKLPEPLQRQLLEQASKTGRITAGDIAAVRSTRAASAVAALPDDVFSPAPLEGKPAPVDWRKATADHIEQALQTLPANQAKTARRLLSQALVSLSTKRAVHA